MVEASTGTQDASASGKSGHGCLRVKSVFSGIFTPIPAVLIAD